MTADDTEAEEEAWSDWVEDDSDLPTMALFDPSHMLPSAAECVRHARDAHGFDLGVATRGRGHYERIQLVNYIRTRAAAGDAPATLVENVQAALEAAEAPPWKSEDCLRPAVADDPLLFSLWALELPDQADATPAAAEGKEATAHGPGSAASSVGDRPEALTAAAGDTGAGAATGNRGVAVNSDADADMDEVLGAGEAEDTEIIRKGVMTADSDLDILAGLGPVSNDGVVSGVGAVVGGAFGTDAASGCRHVDVQVAQMRSLLQAMATEPAEAPSRGAGEEEADEDEDDDGNGGAWVGAGEAAASRASGAGHSNSRQRRWQRRARTTRERVDAGYFGSYDEFGIHQTMLADKVRTGTYRAALEQPWVRGKSLLDVGCGTAILSLFAARAGAVRIFALDASRIVEHAREVVRRNGLDDHITVVRGKAEEVALPVAQVDVIVSEWMGYFLLYEAMLPSVLRARDRWLAPGGFIIPNRATMQLCASSYSELAFWDSVYGFDMGNIAAAAGLDKEADVAVVPPDSVLSPAHTFWEVDIMKADVADLDFSADFELNIQSAGTFRTFVGSFETAFDVPPGAEGAAHTLRTGPHDAPTHWKQTLFHIKEPMEMVGGERVRGVISVAHLGEGRRDLDVSITWRVLDTNGAVMHKERSQLWKV